MKRIAFLTDTHLDEEFEAGHIIDPYKNLCIALYDVQQQGVDEVIFGGDIGEITSHFNFFRLLRPFKLSLILGNHDVFNEVRKYYPVGGMEDELYYSTEDEISKYIFLDSSSAFISTFQMSWLYGELKTHKQILLFIHHPILQVHTPIDALAPLQNRSGLRFLLTASKKKITIFCGHYHMHDETEYKNLRQFTTQALSFQLTKNADDVVIRSSSFSYRIITIAELQLFTEIIEFAS